MSREAQIVATLKADSTLVSLLTGGIYADGALGRLGISRENTLTSDAFDTSSGFLKPTALVRDRALVPFGPVRDVAEQVASTSQTVEIYFYEDKDHTAIYSAKARVYDLLEGVSLAGTYELRWAFETAPIPDVGPIAGATTLRQDWQIISLRGVWPQTLTLVHNTPFEHPATAFNLTFTVTALGGTVLDTPLRFRFRQKSSEEYYNLLVYPDGTLILVEYTTGTDFTRDSASEAVEVGDTVRLYVSGATIKVYVNEVETLSYTSAIYIGYIDGLFQDASLANVESAVVNEA